MNKGQSAQRIACSARRGLFRIPCAVFRTPESVFRNHQSSTINHHEGFTLLELMVSITIIGIITLIIGGAMRLGFRSVDSGEKKMEHLERTRTSLNIIEYQIQSVVPLLFDDNGAKKYSFTGEKALLQFPTNYSIWGGQKGYVTVTYSIDSESDGKKVLSASENTIGLDSVGETRLLDGHDDIYFEYFHKDPTEEKGEWVEEWTDEGNIPEKIRLHLVKGAKDFSLIIPLRARGASIPAPAPVSTAGGEEGG